MLFGQQIQSCRGAIIAAPCVLALAGVAQADVLTQSFTSPWSAGSRKLEIDLRPFDAAGTRGELLSVTFELRGMVHTQFSVAESKGDPVSIRMSQVFSAAMSFDGGAEIASFATKGTLQEFTVPRSSPWFSSPAMLGAISLAPTTFVPGDAAFGMFTGDAPIAITLELDGGTNLIGAPPRGPRAIGMTTGTEWTLDVSYDFIPAPGGVALAGVALLLGSRRRR